MVFKLTKRWVFNTIVEDDDDIQGLVAYSLYKRAKRKVANGLIRDGKSEEEVMDALALFHDQAISSGNLESYRNEAEKYLLNYFLNSKEQVDSEWESKLKGMRDSNEKKIQKIKKEHEKELDDQDKNLLSAIKIYRDRRSSFSKLCEWVLSGVPSAVATFLVMFLFCGVLVVTSSDEAKGGILQGFASMFTGPSNGGGENTDK